MGLFDKFNKASHLQNNYFIQFKIILKTRAAVIADGSTDAAQRLNCKIEIILCSTASRIILKKLQTARTS